MIANKGRPSEEDQAGEKFGLQTQLSAEALSSLLSAIVGSSDDAIISKDLNGVITSWNESAERMFGYTADEAIGQSITLLIPQDRLDEEPAILARIRRGERVDHIETIRQKKDGTLFDISLTISPVRDMKGNVIGASKIARDISTARTASRATALLSAIVDSSDDAIISKDLNGIITSWNKSAERMFGYAAEEIIGQPVTRLIPDDRQDEEPKILARIRRGERVDHIETVRQKKDGTLFDISLTISPVRDAKGNIIGASKIARDITERKRAEAEQKRVENELWRANQDLEQFAYSASHDLQEPLRSVKIYSELLMLDWGHEINDEAREYLTHLRNGASRMEMLVNDLLAYTRLSKYEEAVEFANAGEALKFALANLDGVIRDTHAQVTSDPLPSLPVHPMHLQQLFQNIAGNALKYHSPQRRPVVHVSAVREAERWLFAISDNGIGIEPEYREKIFGLFKRLHTHEQYAGTGIGLAICQRIVERYGGRIWVDSEPGEGSTFHFHLPV